MTYLLTNMSKHKSITIFIVNSQQKQVTGIFAAAKAPMYDSLIIRDYSKFSQT